MPRWLNYALYRCSYIVMGVFDFVMRLLGPILIALASCKYSIIISWVVGSSALTLNTIIAVVCSLPSLFSSSGLFSVVAYTYFTAILPKITTNFSLTVWLS